jgi:hypothetical protein
MEFEHSDKVRKLQERVAAFMAEHVYPNEGTSSHKSAKATDGSRYRSSKA